MEIRQLAAFHAVVTNGTVTRAAGALNYVQSSVTAQVQALETDLAVPLFDRTGRGLVLTDAGRRLMPYAEQVLATLAEAREAVSGGGPPRGVIRISAPESLCTYRLPELLLRCREQHPAITLVFQPETSTRMLEEVRAGRIDVAFLIDERRSAAGLTIEPLAREHLAVVAAPDHPLAARRGVTVEEVGQQTMLLTETGCSYRRVFLERLTATSVRPDQLLEFGSVEAIKQCVRAGMGITVLPRYAVSAELAAGSLVDLGWPTAGAEVAGGRVDDTAPDVVTQMAWQAVRWVSPALEAVMRLAREVIGPETGLGTVGRRAAGAGA